MKNTIELQMRALRPPRVLKRNDAGDPELVDVWAIHHADRPARPFALAVKFGREIAAQAKTVSLGTLFTIRGRLDQNKNPKTGSYHTFVWADTILALVPPKKKRPDFAPDFDEPELALTVAGPGAALPPEETHHA